MTLTFEDAGIFKDRKWQCFCCGKNYNNYEDYSSHVKADHEQGREWIECPDCKAPVRDLKVHYKAKHPARVLPKGVQTRVAVWKDFKPGKDGKTKMKVKKLNFRQGEFASAKCGRDFHYRSGAEEEFYNLLEEDVEVVGWDYESLKIPYFWGGDWHNYIPDLIIKFIDGSTEIWEIKPSSQTGPQYEQNQAKWAAANNYAATVGWDFVVQTPEVGLGKYKQKIKNQRRAAQRTPDQPPEAP